MIAWRLFTNPVLLTFDDHLWFVLPLCVAVAIIYKVIRTGNLRRLPLEILVLLGYMIAGLVVLGVGLWLLQAYWR